MKSIILIVFTLLFNLFFSIIINAQENGIKFLDIELDSAYRLAKSEGKLLFVDCYTDWCSPCKWMDKNVFTEDSVASYFNEHFVNIKLNLTKGEPQVNLFVIKHKVTRYPTYIFLDLNSSYKRQGTLVHRLAGSMTSQSFLQFAKDASNEDVRIGTAHKKYADGNRDNDFIRSYIGQLFEAGNSRDGREICFWFYKDVDWTAIETRDVNNLMEFVNHKSHPYFDSLTENLSYIEKLVDDKIVYSYLLKRFLSSVNLGIQTKNASFYENAMNELNELNYSQRNKLRSEIELYYLLKTNETDYLKKAPIAAESFFGADGVKLNKIASNLYKLSSMKSDLEVALSLTEKSIGLDENYQNLTLKMRLLYTLGKTIDALDLGREIDVLIETTEDLQEYRELHDKLMREMLAGNSIIEVN